jgi:hypothetical protein
VTTGGERSWVSAAVRVSTTIIGPVIAFDCSSAISHIRRVSDVFLESPQLCFSVVRPSKMRANSRRSSADDTETQRKHGRTSSLITVARIALFSFLRRPTERLLCGLLVFIAAQGISVAQSKPAEVVFPISGRELHGFIWKPEGTGPFSAILWNHGSEKLPGSQPALAKFYTEHSYVFFVPHRRGQGRSPGDYIQDLVSQAPPGERARRMVELQQAEVDDVIAALNYLRSQPLNRSSGGTTACVTAIWAIWIFCFTEHSESMILGGARVASAWPPRPWPGSRSEDASVTCRVLWHRRG